MLDIGTNNFKITSRDYDEVRNSYQNRILKIIIDAEINSAIAIV
ncbi:MAG: hypothetical protein Kow0049_10740 [Stanieria sp.]